MIFGFKVWSCFIVSLWFLVIKLIEFLIFIVYVDIVCLLLLFFGMFVGLGWIFFCCLDFFVEVGLVLVVFIVFVFFFVIFLGINICWIVFVGWMKVVVNEIFFIKVRFI